MSTPFRPKHKFPASVGVNKETLEILKRTEMSTPPSSQQYKKSRLYKEKKSASDDVEASQAELVVKIKIMETKFENDFNKIKEQIIDLDRKKTDIWCASHTKDLKSVVSGRAGRKFDRGMKKMAKNKK